MLKLTTIAALALGLIATGASAEAGGKTAASPASTDAQMKTDGVQTKTDGTQATPNGVTMADAEQVKAAQQALKEKGHDPGPIDGLVGPKTRGAVRDFQTKEGLAVTGQLDQDTLAKLGLPGSGEASASPPTLDSPSSAAPSDSSSSESKTELPPRAPDSSSFQNK